MSSPNRSGDVYTVAWVRCSRATPMTRRSAARLRTIRWIRSPIRKPGNIEQRLFVEHGAVLIARNQPVTGRSSLG